MPKIQMKTGTIASLAAKKQDNSPSVPLSPGSVYYAVDTTNHVGKIVYDAPNGNNVDRIVMSTRAEVTDKVITKEDNTHQLFFSGFQSSASAVDGLATEDLIEDDIDLNFKRSRNFYNTETSLIGGNLYINDGLEIGFDNYTNHGDSEVKGSFLTVSSGEVNIGNGLLIGNLADGEVTIDGPLTATNSVEFTGDTASTSVGTGTLLVTGGVGITGQLTANVVQADTQIVINSDNTDSLFDDYNFYVNGTSRLEETVTINDDIQFLDSGTEMRQIRMNVNSTDFGRFATGVAAGNGWSELATSGTGNEPIYIRQYSGVYATLVNNLTLLDADGNSIFPGNILPETGSINIGSSTNQWNDIYAVDFIGHLEGNADTATQFKSPQKVYVNLANASTTTTIQGGSNTAQVLGVNGLLSVANGGTGASNAAQARTNLQAAYEGHTHTTTISQSSNASQITLNANTKYAITAGETSYVFTTPSDTWQANTATQPGYVASPNSEANLIWKTDDNGIPGWREETIAAPIFASITLYKNNWTSSGVYRITNVNVTSDSIQTLYLDSTTTLAMIEALTDAVIVDYGQGTGYFDIKALGDIPNIDINIKVMFGYTTDSKISSMESAAASAAAAQNYANNAAASAASAAQSANRAANYGKIQVKSITLNSLIEDSSNGEFPYKYEVIWNNVAPTDWVDGRGITDFSWSVEAGIDKIILHFSENITTNTTIALFWAPCELVI